MRAPLLFTFILLTACASSSQWQNQESNLPTSMTDNVLADCGGSVQNPNPKLDRDALPLVRIPPIMPPNAEKSGHCKVVMNVDKSGRVSDVMTEYCTDDFFREASLRSVSKWYYNPKILAGEAVERCGVASEVTFKLIDENGNVLPE